MSCNMTSDDLRISFDVASALVAASTSAVAADDVLRALGEGQGWDAAVLWLGENGMLRAHGSWKSERMLSSTLDMALWMGPIALGHCFPGRTWADGRVCWIEDVRRDSRFSRAAAAGIAGLNTGCWVPLGTSCGVVGVLELLSRETRPAAYRQIETLAAAGVQIGQFLKRKVEEEAHQAGAERIRLLIEGIRDYAIVMLDTDGRVTSWNTGAERIYGYSTATAMGAHVSRLYLSEDTAVGKPQAELQAGTMQGRYEADGWRLRKGGVRFWANVVVTVLRDVSARPVGFAMVTSDLTDRRKLEDDLVQLNERLRALASRVNSATEEEKGRLSREIHDVLGQELTNLKMDAAWITRRLTRIAAQDGDAIAVRLQAMIRQIDGCVQTVRRIATGLRPGVLDDLGLVAAIDWQVREFQSRSGITIEASLPVHDLVVDRERATALFRILQEVLTNVSRHAKARCVHVTLHVDGLSLVMAIRDDGCGITEAETTNLASLGILGMRERAALFGGAVDICGAPSEGTQVMIRIPVPHG